MRISSLLNGRIVTIVQFRAFAQSLVGDAAEIFRNELVSSSPSILSSVPLDRLKDNPHRNKSPGDSFLTDPHNSSLLKPMFTDSIANLEAAIEDGYVLVTRIIELPSATDLATPIIKKSLIAKAALLYEDAADRFLKLLPIAILVTGGSPPIGDDLLNARIRDEEGIDRSLKHRELEGYNWPNCLRSRTSTG